MVLLHYRKTNKISEAARLITHLQDMSSITDTFEEFSLKFPEHLFCFKNFWFKNCFKHFKCSTFKTSSCICTKVSLRNSPCNILLQLSKGKRGSVISRAMEREFIEFMRERPSRNPRVNSLHRYGACFYKNLHLYILRLLFLST